MFRAQRIAVSEAPLRGAAPDAAGRRPRQQQCPQCPQADTLDTA